MRNAFTQELPPIGGFIPAPTVIEHDGPEAWSLWDACVRELDNPQDRAAQLPRVCAQTDIGATQ